MVVMLVLLYMAVIGTSLVQLLTGDRRCIANAVGKGPAERMLEFSRVHPQLPVEVNSVVKN